MLSILKVVLYSIAKSVSASCGLSHHQNKQRLSACSDIVILMCWLSWLTCVHTLHLDMVCCSGWLPRFTRNSTQRGPVWSLHMNLNALRPQRAFVLCTRSLWLNTFECIYRLCSHDLLYCWNAAWLCSHMNQNQGWFITNLFFLSTSSCAAPHCVTWYMMNNYTKHLNNKYSCLKQCLHFSL